MAFSSQKETPICLVENRGDGKFVARSDALKILASLNQPFTVVSMIGKYGTGKSYMLNRIANRSGFSVGSDSEAHTKGIWMWCVPNPRKQHHRLLLLDTEGLGSIENDVAEIDTWIPALALLLSNVLVFNSVDVFDQSALKKLQVAFNMVTNIKEQIRASGKYEDHSRFVPNFVWVIRDFNFDLKINGGTVTSDEYLDDFLQGKKGSNETTTYNVVRDSFRNSFPNRKCFVFVSPTTKRKWRLHDNELDKDFITVCQEFCNYVYAFEPINTLAGGNKFSGKTLSILVEECVSLWNSGQIPSPNKSIPKSIQDKNSKAAEPPRATPSDYQAGRSINKMEGLHHCPGGLCQSTLDRHDKPSRKDMFAHNKSYKKEEYKPEMEDSLQGRNHKHYEQNEESTEKCQNLLKSLFKSVDDKLKAGNYAVSGGYQRYVCDRDGMAERYRSDSRNEIKANEVLEKYLKDKRSESEIVQLMDKIIADKEREQTAMKERLTLCELEKLTLLQKLKDPNRH